MKETIHLLIMFALLLGLLIGGEKFYKNRHTVTVAPTDASMSIAEFPSGAYKLNTNITAANQMKSGDVVAFRAPGEQGVDRIGRVAAIEGQRISCEPKGGLLIDNASATFNTDVSRKIPELRVPRGCVYVMVDNPLNGTDSVNFGPLPLYSILGKVVK